MTWGLNNVGQRNVPYGLSNVVAIAAGNYHTVALKSDGTVVAWERNDIGESSVPEGLSNVVAIAAGYAHTVALKQDGTMVAWGYNFFGQSTVPTGLNDVVKIAAGFNHIVVIGRLPPSITAQPFGSAVTVGQSVNFSVAATATGTGPLSYQWRKDGTDILGATDVTFTISAVADTDTGNYSVVVTNSGGSVTSAVAVLTVLNTPVFSVEPFGQSVGVGSNVVFSATAYGAPPLVFQWYFNGSPSGSATTGTNVSLHTLTNVQTNKSGNYSVRVFNGYGSAASAGAALNVIVFPPTITIQPSSQNPLLGHGASFAVSVIGTPPFQYQWQFNGADIPGATNVTYTIPAVTASDAGNYAAMISNSAESVRSDDAALTVVIPPTLGLQTLAGYPLLSLNGMLGSNFSVQFISNWPATNWLNLRSISNLSVNPYQFLDTGGSTQPTRYYRAVMQ